MPAPTRFVELDGTTKCLLIGGSPYHSLYRSKPSEPCVVLSLTPAALTTKGKGCATLMFEIESLDSWLPPQRELSTWLKDAFARLKGALRLDHEVEIQHAEIYAPDLYSGLRERAVTRIAPEEFNDPSQEPTPFPIETRQGLGTHPAILRRFVCAPAEGS